jgi:hypothetical protein
MNFLPRKYCLILIILSSYKYSNQSDILFAQNLGTGSKIEKAEPFNNVPAISFTTFNQPEQGYYYLALPQNLLLVLDNSGTPVFIRNITGGVCNFSLQLGKIPVYYDLQKKWFIGLDSILESIDTFRILGAGYTTDYHMFQMLENRHVLMIGYEYRLMDMSHLVPAGKVNATVTGTVIQEIDMKGNLVYEWKSLDHVPVIGADPCFEDLTEDAIDYFHGNSVAYTDDGNFLVSARNMSQILKINRSSGEIMWRMGGKGNDFDFLNDNGFSGQHSLTLMPGNKLLLFDNGNCDNKQRSRVVLYQFDEEKKTIQLLREFVHPSGVFSSFMGNAQMLPAGNVLAGWGQNSSGLVFTEFKNLSQAIDAKGDMSVWSYSVYKDLWAPLIFKPEKDTLNFGNVNVNEWSDICLTVSQKTHRERTLDYFNIPDPDFEMVTAFPLTLGPDGSVNICLRFRPGSTGTFNTKISLYSDETTNNGPVDINAFQIFAEGEAQNPNLDLPVNENLPALVRIYPNPCTDHICLEVSEKACRITITTTTGKLIGEIKDLSAGEHLFSTSGWKDGVYIVNVYYANSRINSNLLVKISGN